MLDSPARNVLMRPMSWRFLLFVLFLAAAISSCQQGPEPAFLEDRGGLLTVEERGRIERQHRRLLERLDIHLHVTILKDSVPDLDAEAVRLATQYALGSSSRGARGVLLLIDPPGRQARIEVGYDLEAVFTDLLVARIEREQMAPFFASGRPGAGVEATVELLVTALGDIDTGGAREKLPYMSGGGGARTALSDGSRAAVKAPAPDRERFGPQPTPMAVMERYMEILHARIKDPNLELFTPGSRKFFRLQLVTDGQQRQEWTAVAGALGQAEEVAGEDLGVVRFPLERRLPPYLMRRSAKGWMLDVAAMARLIGFNERNEWYFRQQGHPWVFAFADWQFDANGFPVRQGNRAP
jgi:hypothetical protein